jgi:hypothetical protein
MARVTNVSLTEEEIPERVSAPLGVMRGPDRRAHDDRGLVAHLWRYDLWVHVP